MKIFKKIKKHPPDIYPKRTSVPNFSQTQPFWALKAAPKFYDCAHADRQIDVIEKNS